MSYEDWGRDELIERVQQLEAQVKLEQDGAIASEQAMWKCCKRNAWGDGSHTEYSFAQTLREIAADFETEVDGKHADWGGWLREKAKDVERAVAAAEKR